MISAESLGAFLTGMGVASGGVDLEAVSAFFGTAELDAAAFTEKLSSLSDGSLSADVLQSLSDAL